MNDIVKEKKELRKIILFKRRELKKDIWEKNSALIFNALKEHPWYQEAKDVILFIDQDNEVDTRGLILHALSIGKKVYAPVTDTKIMDMDFYEFKNLKELKEGNYGIYEPPKEPERKLDITKASGVMIVPGTAFDKSGIRLGYGGGFYDKYLERIKNLPIHTIAPIFSFQLCEKVPAEPHDGAIECIITEKGVIQCACFEGR